MSDTAMSDPSLDYQGAFLKKVYAGAMMPSWKNGKRSRNERESLTQECCYKSCTHNELRGYCDGTVYFLMTLTFFSLKKSHFCNRQGWISWNDRLMLNSKKPI